MAMIRKDFHQENYKHLTTDELQLTAQEKRANWWHYHKWHVIIGAILLFCLCDILKDVLHIGETYPDYQFAYVGTNSLPDDTVTALTAYLESIGEDLNKDGKVVVEIHQYASEDDEETNSDSAYYQYASEVSLLADITDNDSFFFLLEDPKEFETANAALAYLDGSLPSDTARDYENMYIAWTDSPLLMEADLGDFTTDTLGYEASGDSNALVQGLYLARRGFWSEETCDNYEGCVELWNRLIEDAQN